MKKQSAGILLYKVTKGNLTVLLVHPGGPFWARKDAGAWSVPKGEFSDDEAPEAAARREFGEELGMPLPSGTLMELGDVRMSSGKIIYAWALEGDLDMSAIKSNTFTMEWPPKSGQQQTFPEADKAAWFDMTSAQTKINTAQSTFLHRLAEKLQVAVIQLPTQASLF